MKLYDIFKLLHIQETRKLPFSFGWNPGNRKQDMPSLKALRFKLANLLILVITHLIVFNIKNGKTITFFNIFIFIIICI